MERTEFALLALLTDQRPFAPAVYRTGWKESALPILSAFRQSSRQCQRLRLLLAQARFLLRRWPYLQLSAPALAEQCQERFLHQGSGLIYPDAPERQQPPAF